MSDLDVLRAMFLASHVVWREHTNNARGNLMMQTLPKEEAKSEANNGYFGFYSTFEFDADGRLLSVGAWE